MVIRSLEGLIKFERQYRIAETISIPAQIKFWRLMNRKEPTIVVDLKEFAHAIAGSDREGYTLGGRFDYINALANYFFGEIKKSGANLVFFCSLHVYEGFSFLKNFENFAKPDQVFDCIRNQQSLRQFFANSKDGVWRISRVVRPIERIAFNLMQLCQQYGQVFCSYGLNKAHILAYIRQPEHNVRALLVRDTEYLVYSGDYEFWALTDVYFYEMEIVRYNRQNLYRCMEDINVDQMQLLCALSQLTRMERSQICGTSGSLKSCIPFVKRQRFGPNGYNVKEFSGYFTETQREEINGEMKKLVKTDSYAGSWTDDQYDETLSNVIKCDSDFKLVLNFCQSNIYFAYKLMNELETVQTDLLFIDLRRSDSNEFLETVANTTLKLYGTIFMNVDVKMRPTTRLVYLKTEETAALIERDIICPPGSLNLPCLKDLIVNQGEKTEQMTESRWSLFRWLTGLNVESISRIKLSSDSKHIRLVSFTLDFLVENRLISKRYADVIFQTEIDGQKESIVWPNHNDRFPTKVDIDWVLTAHKYTIAFELICHCLELCGLSAETSLIRFNALKFHDKMQAKMLDKHMECNFERMRLE